MTLKRLSGIFIEMNDGNGRLRKGERGKKGQTNKQICRRKTLWNFEAFNETSETNLFDQWN